MITFQSNLQQVIKDVLMRIQAVNSTDMLRQVAVDLLPVVKDRIHERGLDASGNPIGTYSEGYMKVRTGNFGNASRKTRGKSKGELKDAGVFTRGNNKGQLRPKYNRTNDTKVVISLTRQMENDFSIQPTDTGYGLGYNNADNALKVEYVENIYKKKIFALTADEIAAAYASAQEFINQNITP